MENLSTSTGLTEKSLLKSMEELNVLKQFPDPLSLYAGLKVHTLPPDPPKLRLDSSIRVSPQFRAEYDEWLLERFGVQDEILHPGKVFFLQKYNTVIMRPEDAAILRSIPV